uniref:N-lysine methyltransferase SMYD2-like n=1 Tax=Dermatophagoides pteronyssinus TaxID=6956 RepID=A0A6P6Y7G1_DERPT
MATNRDYQAGEIVSVSLPFVHVLKKEFKGKNCDYCFVECKSNEFGKCGNCKKMYYCGNDCQKKDWNQHKLECKIYKENFDQLQSTGQSDLFFRFVLRLHLYLKRNPFFLYEQHKFLNDKNSSVCIFDIINRMIPTINQDTVSGFLFMSQQYSLLKIKWDPKRMMSCFHLCYEYGIDIFNYEMQSLGSGLYLAESQLKHSCSPNVTSLFNGAQLVMRTTRPIKSGEQI